MKRYAVNWRVWAVLVCLEFAAVCADHVQSATDQQLHENVDISDTDITERGKKGKKKMKYLIPILIGVGIVKTVMIPLALKAMAFVSGKAFLLSALSLILSSIIGLKKFANHGWDRSTPVHDRGDTKENSYQPVPTEPAYLHTQNDPYWASHLHR